jgi:hypothetical protein
MINRTRNLVQETAAPRVRVVRFLRPDLREPLDADSDGCPLLRELQLVVDLLTEGDTLVVNLGLVELFPTAFYSCLLRLRQAVLARKARLVLCRLSADHLEIFQLFKADRLFHVAATELLALREAGAAPLGLHVP